VAISLGYIGGDWLIAACLWLGDLELGLMRVVMCPCQHAQQVEAMHDLSSQQDEMHLQDGLPHPDHMLDDSHLHLGPPAMGMDSQLSLPGMPGMPPSHPPALQYMIGL
jgi:hypothetical protein